MPRFKITIDEKVSVWQTVGVIVEAESEYAVEKGQFDVVEYTGYKDDFPETEDHIEWDKDTVRIVSIFNDLEIDNA